MRHANGILSISATTLSGLVMVLAGLAADRAVAQCGAFNPANPNVNPVVVLGQLDIDQDGVSDAAPDTDGDGLPDNWETGGTEQPSGTLGAFIDRFVNISAPTAIGPGTPPTFLLARQAVRTNAVLPDTDLDGLTDFVEVFGLKFIDDNGNGILDFSFQDANGNGQWDPGERVSTSSEWMDLNGDGLPSIGEFPLPNTDALMQFQFMFVNADGSVTPDTSARTPGFVAQNKLTDYDGFMFTDPTNPDTDGDGLLDCEDFDPLLNPRTFNVPGATFELLGVPGDQDKDNDGVGNGADLGNDLLQAVDNPVDLDSLLKLFRKDLFQARVIPEAVIEDLLGVDWDGNGLFRITEVRDWTPVVTPDALAQQAFAFSLDDLFRVQDVRPPTPRPALSLFSLRTFDEIAAVFNAPSSSANPAYGRRGLPLGIQLLLKPAPGLVEDFRSNTSFIPDRRIWAILYAWRVPGFDIDGNGFVGVPSAARGSTASRPDDTSRAVIALSGGQANEDTLFTAAGVDNAFDRRIAIANVFQPQLDGRIEVAPCGLFGFAAAVAMVLGLAAMKLTRRGR
ncbi:MAG: hypothetical protein HY718_05850 [Planctomycetes bacterium]|nr:hypothetical protein [Planctomycetota bacterium]